MEVEEYAKKKTGRGSQFNLFQLFVLKIKLIKTLYIITKFLKLFPYVSEYLIENELPKNACCRGSIRNAYKGRGVF